MPDVAVSKEDILFMREMEQKLLDHKDSLAKETREETLEYLYKRATINRDFTKGEDVDATSFSDLYRKYKSETKRRNKQEIKLRIDGRIQETTGNAYEKYKAKIDALVLAGAPSYYNQSHHPFQVIWAKLVKDFELNDEQSRVPDHHIDLLARLKKLFENKKTGSNAKDLENKYYEARLSYYQWLKETTGWKAPQGKELYYRLGKESKRLENELANKKREQTMRNKGLFMAKIFALAQGFFIAGGMFGRMLLWGLSGGLMPINIIISVALFSFTTRSNWITINEEMGPLLDKLFFDPNLAHLSPWRRLRNVFRRINIFDGWNTLKGFSNLVAGAMIGILTFTNTVLLLKFMPALPAIGSFSLGVLGSGSLLVFGIASVLALVTTLVYFVISNLNQLKKNADPKWQEPELARLEKMRAITLTSENNPLKRNGFNIFVGLTGISAIMICAGLDLAPIVGSIVGSFLPGSAAVFAPLVVGVTALLVGLAIYGISPFYQARTLNSTKRAVAGDSGLDFPQLEGSELDNLDVTGRNAPDFFEVNVPESSMNWGGRAAKLIYDYVFFGMNTKRDNHQWVRVGNALGQGTPAFMGASAFVVVGLSFLSGFIGIPGAAIMPISMAVGALVGVFASRASYNANSTVLRVVHEHITEKGILERDKQQLDTESKKNVNVEQLEYFHLGEAYADVAFYKNSRKELMKGHDDTHFGLPVGYSGQEKVKAAENMMTQMDSYVLEDKQMVGINNQAILREDKFVSQNNNFPQVQANIAQRKVDRLNWMYGQSMNDGSNPLRQGELAELANEVEYLTGGKYAKTNNDHQSSVVAESTWDNLRYK